MRFLLLVLLAAGASGCRYREEIDGPDADGDGFGELVDCDDGDGAVSPGIVETPYNGVDDDCDEGTPDDDLDGDGAALVDDCDDADAAIHPGASEACNGLDDDCDEATDEAVAGEWYTDGDGDAYGDPGTATTTCTPGMDLVDLGGDCNDADAAIHPDAVEDCEAIDRDCDGFADHGVPLETPGVHLWYADVDGDGFGDPDSHTTACAAPTGYVDHAGDCDDDATSVHAGAAETCDGIDEDCNGLLDDGALDHAEFFLDDDGDGFGDPAVSVSACAAPPGYLTDETDCDDLDAASHPGAAEICDGKSNDCDAQIDEAAIDRTTFFPDVDGDGFGDDGGAGVLACTVPANHVENALDCDDNATDGEDAFPGGFEVCDDLLDNDCDGLVDNAVDALPWYLDADDDGFGDADEVAWACEAPTGYVDDATDCDDSEASPGVVNPDGDEICDGIDDDCNGFVDDIVQNQNGTTGGIRFWFDPDGDGWSEGVDFLDACTAPSHYVVTANIGDCDETDPTSNDGAAAVCDGVDHDCNGFLDGDDDHDGFVGGTDCPSLKRPDCNDASATVYPGRGGCSGGNSCLDIVVFWDAWAFDEPAVAATTWTIANPAGGTREVTCDMVDDAFRPGVGWTLVYNQGFSGGPDGWTFAEAWADPMTGGVAATAGTCGGPVLGPANADPIGIFYKNVSTAQVPHTHAWLDMTYVFIDGWENTDPGGFVQFEYQDRLAWDDEYASGNASAGQGELCSPFQASRGDLRVAVARGILDQANDGNLLVLAAADGDATNEGFALDDVLLWVR